MKEEVKKLIKIVNNNFKKGVTIYQIFLMVFMIIGAIKGSRFLILFSMFHVLAGYFEPNGNRFGLGKQRSEQ